MTRLAILADIHANLPALEAVISDMAQFDPDHVIVAGDLVNGGLFDVEVLQRLHALNWTMIRGNHEFYVFDHFTDRESPARRSLRLLDYLHEALTGWLPRMRSMPDDLTLSFPDGPPVRVFHGLPEDNKSAINPLTPEDEIHRSLADIEETTYIAGHFHIAFERRVGRWHILNPGPVGMSQDGIRKAGYMLLDAAKDGWQPTFRRVDYDFAPVLERYRQLEDQLDVGGYLTILQIKYARPLFNAFFRWRRNLFADSEMTLELADTFLNSLYLWDYFDTEYQVNLHLMPESFSL